MKDRHVQLDFQQVGRQDVEGLLHFLLPHFVNGNAVPGGFEVKALSYRGFIGVDSIRESPENQSSVTRGDGVGNRGPADEQGHEQARNDGHQSNGAGRCIHEAKL